MKSIQGIILAVAGAVAFGAMPLFVKIAYENGTNSVSVVFLRFTIAASMLLIYFLLAKVDFRISGRQLRKAAFLGIVGYTGTGITLFASYQYIPVGIAMALHFVYPSIVAMLARIIYKEKLSLLKIIALAISAVGIYFLLDIKEFRLNLMGAVLALASGLFFAVNALELGRGETRNVDNTVLTFYLCVFAAVGALGYGLLTKDMQLNMGREGWLVIGTLSLVCTVFAIGAFSMAVRLIGSTQTAILNTFEPVTSIVLGAVLLREPLSWGVILGSVLIIAAAIIFGLPQENAAEVNQNGCQQLSGTLQKSNRC